MTTAAAGRLTLPELAAMMRELIRERSYQRETRLGGAVAEYLAWARLRLAPRSLVIYEGYLARLCILLADRDPGIDEVTPEMLLEGFEEHDEGSFAIVRTSYSNLFRWARLMGRRPDNPVELLPRMRTKPAASKRGDLLPTSPVDGKSPANNKLLLKGQIETVLVLKVTGRTNVPWWRSLGLPPPYRWGDDTSQAYIVRTVTVTASTAREAA